MRSEREHWAGKLWNKTALCCTRVKQLVTSARESWQTGARSLRKRSTWDAGVCGYMRGSSFDAISIYTYNTLQYRENLHLLFALAYIRILYKGVETTIDLPCTCKLCINT